MRIDPHMKVALVHDWLTGMRGGERVLQALCEIFPQADVYTLFHVPKSVPPIERRRITTTFLNRVPGIHRYYRYFLPLFPMAVESIRLPGYRLVISTSHCVAKGVLAPPEARHVCYCHSPMRYVWDRHDDYFRGAAVRALVAPFAHYLRMWDVTSAARVDDFVANSSFVAGRIARYYGRSAAVIHPPVDTGFFRATTEDREGYYLVASAFAPYKRIELAIQACRRLGRDLVVIGDGQAAGSLRRYQGNGVRFAGRVSNAELREHYTRARALLFPGVEDFGIMPIESLACGTPVIAFGEGGARETIAEGETGTFFHEQTVEALVDAIVRFEGMSFTRAACRKRALRFSRARFKNELRAYLADEPEDVADASTSRIALPTSSGRTEERHATPLPEQ